MRKISNDELFECLNKCKAFDENVWSQKLNDSQKEEYRKIFNFYWASRILYENVLKDALEDDRNIKRKQIFIVCIGVVLFLISFFLDNNDTYSTKLIFVITIFSFIFTLILKELFHKNDLTAIQFIQRDFKSIEFHLDTVYKIIHKENKFDVNRTDLDEEAFHKFSLQNEIRNLYIRYKIISHITQHKAGTFPMNTSELEYYDII
jgi:hypothetical protein